MKILKRIKRFFLLASPSEEMQKEGEYHAVMLARIFSKVAVTLSEVEREMHIIEEYREV